MCSNLPQLEGQNSDGNSQRIEYNSLEVVLTDSPRQDSGEGAVWVECLEHQLWGKEVPQARCRGFEEAEQERQHDSGEGHSTNKGQEQK